MTTSKRLFLAGALATLVTGASVRAQAQTDTTPPPSSPPPTTASSGSSGGGNGIGVGVAEILSGTPFPAGLFVYDQAMWHLEGLFGFARGSTANGTGPRVTDFIFGAGGWYHLHRGASSDFSLGGVIAVDTTSGATPNTTITSFEPGAQIRAFVTPNIALAARGGFAFRFGDTGAGTTISLTGQLTGAFGLTYFFR